MTVSRPTRSAGSPAVRHRLERVLNDGALALLISVGHRTGLFDVMASQSPSNAAGIARAAGLSRNYVSAWLAAMVSGGIVEHEPASDCYALPAEYARWLSRKVGDDTLVVAAQWLPLLGSIEEDLLLTFVHGKALPGPRPPVSVRWTGRSGNWSWRPGCWITCSTWSRGSPPGWKKG